MSVVIGIDIGSSAIKGVILHKEATENNGPILRTERAPIPPRLQTEPNHFEHDPIAVCDATFEIIRRLTRYAQDIGSTVEAIAFTGQMHGGLILDEKLDPVTNFVTWQDKRGTAMLPELDCLFQHDPTGVGIRNGFLLTTIAWWNANGGLPHNSRHILGIYDWLTSLLIGRAVTDVTSAAAWAMYDPIQKEWRRDVLEALQVSTTLLPDVLEPGALAGTVHTSLAKDLGLAPGTRVHASIGDTQAAYLGSGCTPNDVLLNFGTGSQSMWETTNLVASAGTDIRYLQNGRYLVTAPTLAGGEAYSVMANFISDVLAAFGVHREQLAFGTDLFDQMNRLAQVNSSEGILFDPIFAGSKFRQEAERASIIGLTTANFRIGPLLRALVEGMIEEVAVPYFQRESGLRHSRIIGAGSGMRRNPALQRVAEIRFGLPLFITLVEEEAALGTAKLCRPA